MKDKRVLTSTEISKLLSLSDLPIEIRIAISLMIYYFFDVSQVAALKCSDIFWQEDGAYVNYYLEDKDTFLKIPLRNDLEELIRQSIQKNAKRTKNGYLITNEDGSLYESKEIQAWINKACLKIGLNDQQVDYLLNDSAFSIDRLITVRQSEFQTIAVMDINGIRYLFTDYSISGVFDIERNSFYLQQHQQYIRLIEKMDMLPKNILVLGGGVFVTPLYFKALFPDCNVDVCEIDPEIFSVAKEYFGFDKYENKINVKIIDAFEYLETSDKKYDIVFLDIPCLDQELKDRFLGKGNYNRYQSHLDKQGLLIINILDYLKFTESKAYHCEYENIKDIFNSACLLATGNGKNRESESQNLMIFATNAPHPFDEEMLSGKDSEIYGQLNKIIDAVCDIHYK
ncbi:Spermidine synthase [Dethiosulfatibacter aminovorans DSM 17477]|uniref:Spermidine synthase n=1 Tax=Dethiosulfatibacter aminovorans DSM 17477 TaxID=1121476 RepID=A0A1M6AUQ1_9FIRM|nr:fused MFS/spermidine synthase [Dethiosulfatibacter aminovorans]SHI40157.1 Spermidine synthase [Dethiosulfatibacter aminovorans DSM 17477]